MSLLSQAQPTGTSRAGLYSLSLLQAGASHATCVLAMHGCSNYLWR